MYLQKSPSIQPRAVQHSLVPTCHAPPGSSIPLWLQGSGVSEGKRRHEANKKRSSHVRASMLACLVARLALAFVKWYKAQRCRNSSLPKDRFTLPPFTPNQTKSEGIAVDEPRNTSGKRSTIVTQELNSHIFCLRSYVTYVLYCTEIRMFLLGTLTK